MINMNPKKPRGNCRNCNTKVKRPEAIYCSNKCQQEYQNKIYIERWLKGEITGLRKGTYPTTIIRPYLLLKASYKCEECGWSEINRFTAKFPLTIHHIDGNTLNNIIDNIIVLCPNCHSLTEFYGRRGFGGKDRYRSKK